MTDLIVKCLEPADLPLLLATPPGLFDNPVDPGQSAAFLSDPLHHIVVGLLDGVVVSFASGTILLHPDKAPSLFINEVGTRDTVLRRGYARAVTQALIDHARRLGCQGIWLGTEPDNTAARALYRRLGGDEVSFIGYGWDGALDD
ncbi:GNAT family N-acetyltransferase [Pararhodobacter zhoushanensis]|uniref:GNAT family N-acetyltransferase n=1 Tax=Pararhodobacter zhoushanensis TaxID=2479545 RepID=A0ABT3GZN1_9RHOB|nr:GNAT family N-acetyltransferase [Pararhodobacter zhoushanensis]MCW1932977.1 GNAT family N-acetyltransferase [Pararhodobacter zhoushanensis]